MKVVAHQVLARSVALAASLWMVVSVSGQSTNPFESRRGSEAFSGPGEVDSTLVNSGRGEIFDRSAPVTIYFPSHPPPLGVPVNAPADREVLSPAFEELTGEMMEPYFPQLSSRLLGPYEGLRGSDASRLAEYRTRRDQLLRELRKTIDAVSKADAATRLAGFSALAQSQATSLQKLEAEAESLRRRLASGVNWYELRKWQLGEDNLDLPREQLQVFEYQVVRATAFYRDGLSPAQRRVLREVLQLMDQAEQPGNADDGFVFFSPDMMRVRFPSTLPPDLARRVASFVNEKNELRRQLWDAAFQSDFPKSGYSRRKAMRRFAEQEAERLDALEDEAEQIRLELAPTRDGWRRPPPAELPLELRAMIDEYLLEKREIRFAIDEAVQTVEREKKRHRRVLRSEELQKLKAAQLERMEAARAEAVADNAGRFARLNELLEQIEHGLEPYIMAEDVDPQNHVPDAVLMNFLQRYRREIAFYEYDIAAFEPGLSPAQRQLLFAGAVTRLDLPFAAPELQPVFAPLTILPPQ